MSDTIDRAARQFCVELGFVPSKQFNQRHIIQPVPHGKIRLDTGLRKAVPRAHQLTIVATIDAVADQWAQLNRHAAFEFDGEIRNTAARIETVRRDNGFGRTNINTTGTSTAVLLLWLA